MMKVAFIGSGIDGKIPEEPRNTMFGEALLKYGIRSIYYVPARNLAQVHKLRHKDGSSYTIYIPCSVPLINRYFPEIEKKSMLLRRLVNFFEFLLFLIRVLSRLSHDKVDVTIILHLWDSSLPLLSPMLSWYRPTAILWMGHSLRWHAQFKWLYTFLVPFYKLVLRKPVILTPIDIEQKMCLFKILKLPQQNVYRFNPCIVDEKMFHERDKEKSAKIVGFDTKKFNILTMMAIRDPELIERSRSSDYQKDVFHEVEIFRLLVKNDSKVHLHIVGDGPGFKKLKNIISQYNLQDKITLHGWINEHRPLFINASDLAFNPCRLIEFNDGTAIFEAFQCGKPVVAFKRYPWVSTEHKGGFLIDTDLKVGAKQIASRLDPIYLEKKSKEAKYLPYDHNVPMTVWGKRLSEILKEMLREEV